MKSIVAVLVLTILFGSIQEPAEEICIHFTFPQGLQPGQTVELVGPLHLNGAGVTNVDSEAQFERDLCFNSDLHPATIKVLDMLEQTGTEYKVMYAYSDTEVSYRLVR